MNISGEDVEVLNDIKAHKHLGCILNFGDEYQQFEVDFRYKQVCTVYHKFGIV